MVRDDWERRPGVSTGPLLSAVHRRGCQIPVTMALGNKNGP